MAQGRVIQDSYLEKLRDTRASVSLYLLSGVRVRGRIECFDQFMIGLEGSASQSFYKRAVATIVPESDVRRAPHSG